MYSRGIALLAGVVVATACTGRETVAPTPAPASPASSLAPVKAITIAPPLPIGPPAGMVSFGWPTLTVANAERTGTNAALLYRFDLSEREDFQSVELSEYVAETPERTSFTPSAPQAPLTEGTFYWRAVAIDQPAAVQSEPSQPRGFTYIEPTEQNRIAAELGAVLWPGPRPTGRRGRARLGPGWQVRTITSFDGVTFLSPPIEALRLFDLLDLGQTPDQAIGWMRGKGYPSVAAWYPDPIVIGLPFQYIALVQGRWELVVRVGG